MLVSLLNKGNEYCTVEQEIGHLHHYVDIQKIRYPILSS